MRYMHDGGRTSRGRWAHVVMGAGCCCVCLTCGVPPASLGERMELDYQVSTDPRDMSGYGPAITVDGVKYQKTGHA